VYLHAYEDVAAARAGIGRYLCFCNEVRPHQSLGYQTPTGFYAGGPAGVGRRDRGPGRAGGALLPCTEAGRCNRQPHHLGAHSAWSKG
jgi:hypothetical protein